MFDLPSLLRVIQAGYNPNDAPASGNTDAPTDAQSLHARALAALAQARPTVNQTPIAADAPAPAIDASTAGAVPSFQPAPGLVEHHGILSRALSAIGHGVHVAADKAGNALAPIDPALAATMTPQQIAQMRSAALFDAGTSMLGNTTDAHGQGTTFLERLGAGLRAGRAGGMQSASGAIQANQFATQQAQARDLATKRGQIQRLYAIQPGDTSDIVDKKVQAMAASYAAIGDTQSLNALGQASALFKQPKAPAPRALSHIETIDPSTGKPAIGFYDQETGTIVKYAPAVPKVDPSARAMSVDQADKGIDRVVKTYEHETQDFTKARSGYEVLQGAMKAPNLYSPIAMLDAYARTINPGAIVRPSTMELLEHTGAATDRVRRWATTVDKGVWPADLSAALNASLTSIMRQHYTTAQAARGRALARLNSMHISDADTYLDPLDFGPNTPGATPPIATPSANSSTRGNY